ncbi:MAG: ATP-binding protein [Termitinemataceae bacterium]
MKILFSQQRTTTLTVPALVFIYLLLGILVVLFSSNLVQQLVHSQNTPIPLYVGIFILISVVLALFLAVALLRMIRDMMIQKAGSRLRIKLFFMFFAFTLLISVPTVIIHLQLFGRLLETWNQAAVLETADEGRYFALDAYRYRLTLIDTLANDGIIDRKLRETSNLARIDPALLAVQQFSLQTDGGWNSVQTWGDTRFFLASPPATSRGFASRNPARDIDCIRYVDPRSKDQIFIYTFSLGDRFDERLAKIETTIAIAENINGLYAHVASLMTGFYLIYFLPILLMTVIIAISLSNSISLPIVHLIQATGEVARGNLSYRIMSRPDDDLGILIDSFNTMVRNLEQAQNNALQTEKINIWKDMSQRLAHEIKNPLTPIKLSAERVLRRWKTDPEHIGDILETCMLAIIQETDGLTNLLTDFRTFSRLPPPNLEQTPLKPLIEEAINIYRLSYPEIGFITEQIHSDIVVQVDRRHIIQVLSNLFANSIDAMHQRGTITITTDLVKKEDSRYCRISVRDTGCGIPPENRALIFTPYFTTKAAGTGLGLSIVERIILDHGGAIWFDSAVGVGTTFYIDVPIDEVFQNNESNSDN